MELTAEQRAVADRIQREVAASVDAFLALTPEENLAQGIETMRRQCEELNALEFDEFDVEKWKEQVESIRWRVEVPEPPSDVLASVVVSLRFRRSIEQVYFTATVG